MNPLSGALLLLGSGVAVLAGIGVLRFETPYARFHSAGKASPVAIAIVALGAALELGWSAATELGVVVAAMVLTLPTGMHLLFRATHRSGDNSHLHVDELADAERHSEDPGDPPPASGT